MRKTCIVLAVLIAPLCLRAQDADTVLVRPNKLDQQSINILKADLDKLYPMLIQAGVPSFEHETSGLIRCVPQDEDSRDICNGKAYRFCLSPVTVDAEGDRGFLQVHWLDSSLTGPRYIMYLTWAFRETEKDNLLMQVFFAATKADTGALLPEKTAYMDETFASLILRDLRIVMEARLKLQDKR